MQFARNLGRSGSVVDEYGALLYARESPICSQCDLAQVIVVADAGEYEFLSGGGVFRRRWVSAAMLGDPFFGFGGGGVVDGDLVPAFILEMTGHRISHDSKTDKRHLRHRALLRMTFQPIC